MLFLLSGACTLVRSRNGVAASSSQAAEIRSSTIFCVRAQDNNSGTDISRAVFAAIQLRIPSAREGCGCEGNHVDVEFRTGDSSCIECGAVTKGPRFASAQVVLSRACSTGDPAEWESTTGGSLSALVNLFARDLSRIYAAPNSALHRTPAAPSSR
jgi:hypothetical protein